MCLDICRLVSRAHTQRIIKVNQIAMIRRRAAAVVHIFVDLLLLYFFLL